jgi:hypothetical protein
VDDALVGRVTRVGGKHAICQARSHVSQINNSVLDVDGLEHTRQILQSLQYHVFDTFDVSVVVTVGDDDNPDESVDDFESASMLDSVVGGEFGLAVSGRRPHPAMLNVSGGTKHFAW